MLNVIFTVDVEIWCDGWTDLDKRFPTAFQQYIFGRTPRGNFGLPYQLAMLKDHGLSGVFFVEPLFSTRFGRQPLADILGLINAAHQEVQLHLHTEWVDESRIPLLQGVQSKRQHLRQYSIDEQTILIAKGARLLIEAGAPGIEAFRAGSFAFNRDTLKALGACGIFVDSSYNASQFGLDSGVLPGQIIVEPIECDHVREYPMTVFRDGTRSLRHTQLTACSYREMEGLLWRALEMRRNSFVILSHNFELLNPTKDRPDDVVVKRFHQLCAFLDKNRDSFHTTGFQRLKASKFDKTQPPPLVSPVWKTGARMVEQAYRLRYR